MEEPFVILERTELFPGDLSTAPPSLSYSSTPSNGMQYDGKPEFGALCSIVLGKIGSPGGRNSPPLRLNLRDSVGLNKGDTIAIDCNGPFVTKFQQLDHPKLHSPVWPELKSNWETGLLGGYFPLAQIVTLSTAQQHEVYAWLCNEPMYLVFYKLFSLPRLTYAQYCQAHSDFQPITRLYTEEQAQFARDIVLSANERWRHGYTPHVNDIRIDNSPMRITVTEIFSHTQLYFNTAGWLCWPYPSQIEERLSVVLSNVAAISFPLDGFLAVPKQDLAAPTAELMAWINACGFKLLRVVNEGCTIEKTSEFLVPFYKELCKYGCTVVDCAWGLSLDQLRQRIKQQYNILLLNVHLLPLFALFQLCTVLTGVDGTMYNMFALHYVTTYDSSTTHYLEKLADLELLQGSGLDRIFTPKPRCCFTQKVTPHQQEPFYTPDYEPELRLENPSLYMSGYFNKYAVVPGFELFGNAISLVSPNNMHFFLQFYAQQRQVAPTHWEYNFVVATDHDKRRVYPDLVMAVHGGQEFKPNVRCTPASENFMVPCRRTEEENTILRVLEGGETEHCSDLQQLECITLDELTFMTGRTFYYSSIPITTAILQKLLAHTTLSLVLITENANLHFCDPLIN